MSDFAKLQPHMYKRRVSKESVKGNCPGKESSDWEEDTSRTGNTLICSCGKYKPMATHVERIFWLDKYEIRDYFIGVLSFAFEIFLSSNLLVRKKKISVVLGFFLL